MVQYLRSSLPVGTKETKLRKEMKRSWYRVNEIPIRIESKMYEQDTRLW